MSVWTKDNCIITAKGNEALTEISAKGGTMSFDSVWTCATRVDSTNLYNLTDLPQKNQKMTLVKYSQVSSGYTINVQVTNEDLTTPYAIEMVGVYMKLSGFNNGNPFLYMVLLTDEGTADQMTNISRSTYKYSIYLYHTNKAVLNISLTPTDYVSADTYNEGMEALKKDMLRSVYHTDFSMSIFDGDSILYLHTEHYDTNVFIRPSIDSITTNPLLIIHGYSGGFASPNSTGEYSSIYIDEVGPYTMIPFEDNIDYENHTFNNADLVCVVMGDYLKVLNYFDDNKYIVKDPVFYNNFNNIPISEGVYSLSGNASNAPVSLSSTYVWSCSVVKSGDVLIVLAINTYNNNIYRRYITASASSWSSASSWASIGGGGGIQTAKATFVTTGNSEDPGNTYLRIMRDNTTNALKAGDVIMCTLTTMSTLKFSIAVVVRFLDSSTPITKYIYNVDNTNLIPCCQLPKYFLLEYDGSNFHILTPLNVTTTLSTVDPISTDGKYGDIWYTY